MLYKCCKNCQVSDQTLFLSYLTYLHAKSRKIGIVYNCWDPTASYKFYWPWNSMPMVFGVAPNAMIKATLTKCAVCSNWQMN